MLADLLSFIDRSPSPFHAVASVVERLTSAGFNQADRTAPASTGRQFVVDGGALVAWDDSEFDDPTTGFRIVGAHTDSPNLRVKPQPDSGAAGFHQVGVEVYGGVLLNSWLDRDLGLSGRLAFKDGKTRLVRIDAPVARVPQLAIHLDRDVSDKGLVLNRQKHLAPIWGLGEPSSGGFLNFVVNTFNSSSEDTVAVEDVVHWDLMFHDLTPSAIFGAHNEFFAAPRIDNLLSVHAATTALLGAPTGATESFGAIPVVAFFDHEEVGSTSSTGAASPSLPTVLERSVLARGGDRDQFHRALASSHAVSADGAHATHPNYADRHEPEHQIALNQGPVLKINANQRYATDAESAQPILVACAEADIEVQRFVTRTDLGCGSTIGPMTAATAGIAVVDFGAPQLSMHSAREMSGAADPELLSASLGHYLRAASTT